MKNKLLLTLLVLCMVLALQPGAARAVDSISYPVDGGNIYFDAATGAITGCDDDVTTAIIPSEINGVPVTSIGESAFCYCNSLTNVVIPDGVTSIGYVAFGFCGRLTSITIPNSVIAIGGAAFHECSSLAGVTIPDSVISIGDGAFYYCDSLTSVTIPNSVTTIEDTAFANCSNLTSIYVASGNSAYVSDDGVLFNADRTHLLAYPAGKSTPSSYDIPESVISIGYAAFEGCRGLTSVTIPDSVTTIEWKTFSSCSSLKNVTIPSSVTAFGTSAFAGCPSLADIYYGGSESQWVQINMEDDENDIGYNQLLNQISNHSTTVHYATSSSPATAESYGFYQIKGSHFAISFDAAKVEKKTVAVQFSGTGDVLEPNQTWNVTLVKLRPGSNVAISSELRFDETGPCVSGHPGRVIDSSHFAADQIGGVDYVLVGGLAENSFYAFNDSPQEPDDMFWLPGAGGLSDGYFIFVDTETGGAFTDVPASKYYAEPVAWAVDNGIAYGTSSTQFSPNQNCTNAQILTFLWRAYGEPEPSVSNPFTNSINEAYVKAARWAYEKGMVPGGTFDAKRPCSRAMAVTYMWQAAGSPTSTALSTFTDVPPSASYAQAVAWAVTNGITSGTSSGQFSPDATCTRAQIVTFLWRNLV